MNPEEHPQSEAVCISTHFVRERNALLAEATFSGLYLDHYLHLADLKAQRDPEHDAMFKQALAFLTLHAATRPANETIAWTINFQSPLLNVFVNASNPLGTVVGRCFTENVREADENFFFSETVRGNQPIHRSSVTFKGPTVIDAVSGYYQQSEQRQVRLFEPEPEQFILVAAQPDCDLHWLGQLEASSAKSLLSGGELSPLEKRDYRWHCGCSHEKLMDVLSPMMKKNPEALFHGDTSLHIHCPRCGTPYIITREALEARG